MKTLIGVALCLGLIMPIIVANFDQKITVINATNMDVGPLAFDWDRGYMFFGSLFPNNDYPRRNLEMGIVDLNDAQFQVAYFQKVGESIQSSNIPFVSRYSNGFVYQCTDNVLIGPDSGLVKYRVSFNPYHIERVNYIEARPVSCIFDTDPVTGDAKFAYIMTKALGLWIIDLETMEEVWRIGWSPDLYIRDAAIDNLLEPTFGYFYHIRDGVSVISKFDLTKFKRPEGEIVLKDIPTGTGAMLLDEQTHHIYLANPVNTEILKIRADLEAFEVVESFQVNPKIDNAVDIKIENFILDRDRDKLYIGFSITQEIVIKGIVSTAYEGALAIVNVTNHNVIDIIELSAHLPDGTELITDVGRFGFNSYIMPPGSKYAYMPCSGTYPPGTGTIVRLNCEKF
eukprot:TRINITY_DN679_c0_g2_i1.p1 TRINITY_DN679_c0_g2~~TRINITY_DN679_c0_g2_i1.p1  ORF type:complete len:398 (-),score=73.65 TRINITY_DN679_c0_g2_i1:46-1239(-)